VADNESQNIINKIQIKDIDIIKYIKLTNNEKLIRATMKYINENKNILLKTFLQNFLSKYDTMCKHFIMFYEELYEDIGLTDFSNKSFIYMMD
jgi:hypothetical protein